MLLFVPYISAVHRCFASPCVTVNFSLSSGSIGVAATVSSQLEKQDRKTKLPLCRNFNRENGSYNPSDQQFYATAWLMANVRGVEEFRRIRFNMVA